MRVREYSVLVQKERSHAHQCLARSASTQSLSAVIYLVVGVHNLAARMVYAYDTGIRRARIGAVTTLASTSRDGALAPRFALLYS